VVVLLQRYFITVQVGLQDNKITLLIIINKLYLIKNKKMEKITLKLYEFYSLESEINGLTNKETNEVLIKGLLNEKIKLTTKYWLTDLVNKLISEITSIDKLKEGMGIKYGKNDGSGNYSIEIMVDNLDEEGNIIMVTGEDGTQVPSKVVNPLFIGYQNELNELLSQERDVEYRPLKLSDFDEIVTTDNYQVIFKLIEKGTN